MSRTAADLITARILANTYRGMAKSIDEEVREIKESMPLTKRILRQYAAIARRAAIAEELDPEWRA